MHKKNLFYRSHSILYIVKDTELYTLLYFHRNNFIANGKKISYDDNFELDHIIKTVARTKRNLNKQQIKRNSFLFSIFLCDKLFSLLFFTFFRIVFVVDDIFIFIIVSPNHIEKLLAHAQWIKRQICVSQRNVFRKWSLLLSIGQEPEKFERIEEKKIVEKSFDFETHY